MAKDKTPSGPAGISIKGKVFGGSISRNKTYGIPTLLSVEEDAELHGVLIEDNIAMAKSSVTQIHHGSGHNIIADTVNFGKQPFALTDQVIDDVVAQIGAAKLVRLHSFGNFALSETFRAALAARVVKLEHVDHLTNPGSEDPLGIHVSSSGDVSRVSFNPS